MAADNMHVRRTPNAHAVTRAGGERTWRTWYGVTGGLLVWGAHHGISYGLAAWFVCGGSGRLVLLATAVVAAALVIGACLASWGEMQRANERPETGLEGTGNVNGFLGMVGLTTGLIALTGIAYNGLSAIFFSSPC